MKIGFIGLGRMGRNMVLSLMLKRYEVVVYNRSVEKVNRLAGRGAIPAYSLKELAGQLPAKKVVFIMVTAGQAVDSIMDKLLPLLSVGDVVIDAGNSHFEDSIRRSKKCKKKDVNFLDMGTSGGLEGARYGASLTIGGDFKTFKSLERVFRDLAVRNGYAHLGPSGAGHFAKMVHNGIEYALLEAYGEGFELLEKSKYKFDYAKISRVWSRGSVIRSWLTELAHDVFRRDPTLKDFKGVIGGGQTGQWTVRFARKQKIDVGAIAHALRKRKLSLKKRSFGTKVVAALRNEFGAHTEPE